MNFGLNKSESLPHQCKQYEYLFACYGSYPKDRFVKTSEREPELNYLCDGYKKYFKYVHPLDLRKYQIV
jgi:uncharacterized protein